jgi:hypothetical protein
MTYCPIITPCQNCGADISTLEVAADVGLAVGSYCRACGFMTVEHHLHLFSRRSHGAPDVRSHADTSKLGAAVCVIVAPFSAG